MPYWISKKKWGDNPVNVAKMESCVLDLSKQGRSKESAIRICKASIFEEWTNTLVDDEIEVYRECKKKKFSEFAEVTANLIRIRQKDPNDFEKNSFRVINLDKSGGITAVIWRLKGKTSTTVQSYLFEKEKRTIDKAEKWVKDHEWKTSMNEQTIWGFSDIWEFKEVKEWETVEIQIMRKWKWEHPMYWEVKVDEKTLDDVIKNFEENKRWIDLAIDENHEPNHKALGWIRKVYKEWKDALFATIELTKLWADLISQWAYKYFSPEIIFNKRDEETWETIKNLLVWGAFTNRPFFKAMTPVMANEEVADKLINGDRKATNILFFNSSSMKTILELLAKFAENKNLSKEDKELLKATFSEMWEDDKTAELTSAVDEATADEKAEEDETKEDKEDEKKEDSADDEWDGDDDKWEEDKEITLKASEYESLKDLASQASKLIKEKRKDMLTDKVKNLTFSETNKIGVVLPKMTKDVVDFALSLNEKASDKFLEIIKNLQTVSASEIWHDKDNNSWLDQEKINFFMEKLWMTEEEAKTAYKQL